MGLMYKVNEGVTSDQAPSYVALMRLVQQGWLVWMAKKIFFSLFFGIGLGLRRQHGQAPQPQEDPKTGAMVWARCLKTGP